jgi:Fe-S cluster assembly protein SufD
MATSPNATDYGACFSQQINLLAAKEPDWLAEKRREGINEFNTLGFPSGREEIWKYNNPRAIADGGFLPVTVKQSLLTADPYPWLLVGVETHRLVFVDGFYIPSISRVSALPAGVMIERMDDRADRRLGEKFGKAVEGDKRSLTALNTAFFSSGLRLEVADGIELDQPVQLLFLSSGRESTLLSSPRNLIQLGRGSRATVIETYASLGADAGFSNGVTEIYCGENSQMRHIKLQRENEKAFHVGCTLVRQESESRYISTELNLGGAMSRLENEVHLVGLNALCQLDGLYIGRGKQRLDQRTRVVHDAPDCRTRELYKGILDNQAIGIFDGLILVKKGASGTDGQQTNRNLLLSEEAAGYSMPRLEIYNDDVRCTHGSTTGAADDDQMFYLRSRGLDQHAAQAMLTYAFASELIDRVEPLALQKELRRIILDRLPWGDEIRRSL